MKRQNPQPYPLTWPDGKPRSTSRKSGQFQRTEESAVKEIRNSLERMNAGAVTISTNKVAFSDAKNPKGADDPGVAVWFTYKGQERVIAIDSYYTLKANLCAMANTLEALRTVERHGGVDIFDQAMQGFNVHALPAPSGLATHAPKRPWFEVLGIFPEADPAVVDAAYRALAKTRHPDAPTGSTEAFQELQGAYDEYKAARDKP